MSRDNTSTRRSFLRGGALLAAPIAAASVSAVAAADDALKARVKRLEDETALRDLHQSWLRRVNAGARDSLLDHSVRRIVADDAGAPDAIEIAADGRSATGKFDCLFEVEAPLAKDCTLAQMAHAQGHGTFRRTERRTLVVDYTKATGVWKVAKVAFAKPFATTAAV